MGGNGMGGIAGMVRSGWPGSGTLYAGTPGNVGKAGIGGSGMGGMAGMVRSGNAQLDMTHTALPVPVPVAAPLNPGTVPAPLSVVLTSELPLT